MNLEKIREIEKQYNIKIIYITVSGSKLYGTDNENSDTDYKGIFIPSVEDVLLKRDKSSIDLSTNKTNIKNSKEDVDITLHSIHSYFNQLSKFETGAADVLFSMFRKDTIIYETPESKTIKDNYKLFLNKNMKSFIGYALGQTKKFGIKGARYNELDNFVKWLNSVDKDKSIKLENLFDDIKNYIKENNTKYIKFVKTQGSNNEIWDYISILGKLFHGSVTLEYFITRINQLYNQFGNRTKTIASTDSKTDFKALSHAYRVAYEVEELLETSFIRFPLNSKKFIKSIKEGKQSYEGVVEIVQQILERVDLLLLESKLPEEANRKEIDKILLNYYKY